MAAANDDDILDRLLTEFLEDVAEGRARDLALAVPGRPDLRARIEDTWNLALEIAPRRPVARPVFAGYEMLRELGRGGMGHVHLARHVKLGRTVALKVLPMRLATQKSRERFLREARAVARLSHPLVVPVYDLGEEDGQPYFTMAYVEGRTLAGVLDSVRGREPSELTGDDLARAVGCETTPPRWRGPWWKAVATIASDVADALTAAHAQGIVHRDVKPSNVMLRTDGFALLFDFGLADVEDEATLTMSRGFLGTPQYASPEQAAGRSASLDARSDVFSLGATLHESLTLEVPFPGPTVAEILRRVQTWDAAPVTQRDATAPKDLATVVLAAMEKEPTRRTGSAAELAEDLRRVIAGEPVRARRAGVIERGLRLVKRNRALTELLVEQQSRNAELREAVLRAERNEKLAQEREAEARAARETADAERRRALGERDRAEAIRSFLLDTFAAADPDRQGGRVALVDVMRLAAGSAMREFDAQPMTRIDLLDTIGNAFFGMGAIADAISTAETVAGELRRELGEFHPRSLRAEVWAAMLHAEAGDLAAGLARADAAIRRAEEVLPRDAPESLAMRIAVAGTLVSNDPVAAAEHAEIVWRDVQRAGRLDDEQALHARNNLAVVRMAQGRTDEAVDLLRDCVELRDRAGLAAGAIVSRSNLGQALKFAGRAAEAERVLRGASELALARLGPGHVETINARHNLAGLLLDAGRLDEASAIQQELAAAIGAAVRGWTHLRRVVWLQLARIESRRSGHAACAEAADHVLPALIDAGDGSRAPECAALAAAARSAIGGPAAAARWLLDVVSRSPAIPWSASEILRSEVARLAAGLHETGETDLALRLVSAAGSASG